MSRTNARYWTTAQQPFGIGNYYPFSIRHESEVSPRVNGVLQFRENWWRLDRVVDKRFGTLVGDAVKIAVSYYGESSATARAVAIAESDLRHTIRRKIMNGNVGALGVSIATAGQSIAMMRGAAGQLIKIFSAAERFYQTTKGKRRLKRLRRLVNRGAKPTAGMVLEGFFGWAPLMEDFKAAAFTCSNPWPPGRVSAKKSWAVGLETFSFLTPQASSRAKQVFTRQSSGASTYATSVEVGNPNVFLANKLGLLNLPGIVWDLVPWSFLVNAVSNMGQVLGSLTDFSGLSLTGSSLTRRKDNTFTCDYTWWYTALSVWRGYSHVTGFKQETFRLRQLGVPPPSVSPYLKFPQWGVGTAAITGSLLIQQIERLRDLVRL